MKKVLVVATVLTLMVSLVGGTQACASKVSEEALSVAELLNDPVYDTPVTVHGEVSLLGELLCPCFELSSGGAQVVVWYDLMVENDGTERPAVSVDGIENGDWVIVTGELRHGGGQLRRITFWASNIEKSEPVEPDKGLEIRLAPIHDVQVNIAESYPPQVFVYVKGGLSDSCTTVHELTKERSGNVIDIEVTTQRPKGAVCALVYGFFEKNVNLGSDFTSGETYTINVNHMTTSFVMP